MLQESDTTALGLLESSVVKYCELGWRGGLALDETAWRFGVTVVQAAVAAEYPAKPTSPGRGQNSQLAAGMLVIINTTTWLY